MALTDDLISYLTKLKYEDLPAPVVEITKKMVLDTLACIIAGSSEDMTKQVASLAIEWRGKEEATIPFYEVKVPAPAAAMVNCIMARARDFDDVHEYGGTHVCCNIIPPAFIFSEYSKMFKGKVISGRDFILATVVGAELQCRIPMAGLWGSGWTSETWAPIAIGATGAKLLDFDETKTLNSIGIGYTQCSGSTQSYSDGADTGRLTNGISGTKGVLAVLLASDGFTGPSNFLEGKGGIYSLYMRGKFSPQILMGELGQRFEIARTSVKIFPGAK